MFTIVPAVSLGSVIRWAAIFEMSLFAAIGPQAIALERSKYHGP